MYNLEKLFKGIVSVKENDGLILVKRFTDKQLDTYYKYGNEATLARAKSLASVKMEFVTEKKELSFDFIIEDFCRDRLGFDVYENGILKKVDTREINQKEGSFLYLVKAEGKVKIEIYFMFSCNLIFKNLSFGDIEYIEEEKINYLALGDSITQGMETMSASINYPSVIERMYNLNVLNHGVGGFVFCKDSIDKSLPFSPDIITIAYGVNDAMKVAREEASLEDIFKNAKEYIDEIIALYPHATVKIITPVWFEKEEDGKEGPILNLIRQKLTDIGNELGIEVINGLTLVPNCGFYYGDLPATHPNTAGFLHYALNLNIR